MADEDDIISTLPDAILCHILSFLPTKCAVTTSILSKRWKNLWLSVTTLNFTNLEVTDEITNFRFNNFVYSVLLSRDAALPIKTFSLAVIADYPPPDFLINNINKWVNFVVQRRVQYVLLQLVTNTTTFPKLPISILTCTTLVVLKLSWFKLEEDFPSVVLPSLRALNLRYFWLPKLRDFLMFLNRCPILEDLLTFEVEFDSVESLTYNDSKSFCLSNLTRADIDCARYYFPLKVVHNVLSLRFEIDQVHYSNDLIPTFGKLIQLELISLDYSWQFLLEVLNHCPKLEMLDLDQADEDKETWTRKDDKENWVDPDAVPQCLSLHLRTCNLFNFLGLQGELLLARYILKNARVLQTMKIWNSGQPDIERIVSSFPKASSTCKLTFYHDS